MQDKINRMNELVNTLNEASIHYYQYSSPIMTDYEYDKLYDELYPYVNENGMILIQEVKISNTTTLGILSPSFHEWCNM